MLKKWFTKISDEYRRAGMNPIVMISPMLLSEYRSCEECVNQEPDVFIQPKLDGWRCVVDTKTGTLYSRSGNKINLPHISADVIGRDLPEFIDGELYCHGFTLGQIQSMIRKGDTRIKLHIFDVISDAMYENRADVVAGIAETENVKLVETHRINPADIESYYHRFLNAGYEGAVIRYAWARYEQRRVRTVIKLKPVYN